MSDFLSTIAARTTGAEQGIMPRPMARFEPAAPELRAPSIVEESSYESASAAPTREPAQHAQLAPDSHNQPSTSPTRDAAGPNPIPAVEQKRSHQPHVVIREVHVPGGPATWRETPAAPLPTERPQHDDLPPSPAARPSLAAPTGAAHLADKERAEGTWTQTSQTDAPQPRLNVPPPDARDHAPSHNASPTEEADLTPAETRRSRVIPPESDPTREQQVIEPGIPPAVAADNRPMTVPTVRPASSLKPLDRDGPRTEQTAPTIHVTIGRVEVRAPAPTQRETPRNAGNPAIMPLNEYLRRHKGGA
jgi:hypothetical protein